MAARLDLDPDRSTGVAVPEGDLRRALALSAVATTGLGVALAVEGQASYVDRITPVWTAAAGGLVALTCLVPRARALACVATTVFLLPAAVAGVFHAMRSVRAIPLPVDWLAFAASASAALTLWVAWRLCRPLQLPGGAPLETPRWVAGAGIAAALVYPAIKTAWLAGASWLAPRGLDHGVDAAYVVPVGLALIGTSATLVALRWWERPAPRWARPAATVGGLTLIGLGSSGVNATLTTTTPEGPALGMLVYGSWFLWGLTTLAVAGRLSSGPVPQVGDSAAHDLA